MNKRSGSAYVAVVVGLCPAVIQNDKHQKVVWKSGRLPTRGAKLDSALAEADVVAREVQKSVIPLYFPERRKK